jgi:hypothetical protein
VTRSEWLVRNQGAIGVGAVLAGLILGLVFAQVALDYTRSNAEEYIRHATVERTSEEDGKRRACEAHKGREYVQATPASVGFCVVRQP